MLRTYITLESLRNRTGSEDKEDDKTLVHDKHNRAATYAFCGDLHLIQSFLVFYKKTCLKEGEVWPKSFSNKIILTLVTQRLPSSFLSHPVASTSSPGLFP